VIVFSIILITIIYLLVNWALISGLGMDKLANSKTAPADLLAMAFGPLGEKLLGLFVAIAALTSINATMIVGARTNYAIGEDWEGLRFMGRWEAARGSPHLALLVQSAICLALVGFGALQADGFDAMVEFTAPVFWLFLFLVGVAVFILRFKQGDVKRYSKVVSIDELASFESGTVHEVYSTFALARDAEWSGRLFVLEMKEEGEEGIGTRITVEHKSPSFVGQELTFIATFEEITARNEIITSYQVCCGERIIAEGIQGQKILKKETINALFNSLQT
jgi:predicted thioesterase